MSAAQRPTEPSEPSDGPRVPAPGASSPGDAEGWALLEALRRRLDDQAAQGRKTQLQVTQLAESIGALVDTQRQRSRWANLNSFVAYVLFTVLVGAGFYALYRSRATELVDARDRANHDRDLAVGRAETATATLAARDLAARRAWELHEQIESGKRVEAMAALATLDGLPLTRLERSVLAARAHETQVMEAEAALKGAAAAFKAGRHGDAIAPLEAALAGDPRAPRAAAMHYYLGVAYAKTSELASAALHLQAAIGAEAEHEDVRFHLASALDRSGQYARARAEYNRFANAHPQSGLAVFALRRSGTLARMPAVAPTAKPSATPPSSTPPSASPPTVTPAPPANPTVKPAPKPASPPPTVDGPAPG